MAKAKGFSAVEGLIIVLGVVVVGLSGWFLFARDSDDPTTPTQSVSSYEECAAAGYPILESFPQQCSGPDGKTYTMPISQEEQEEFDIINADGEARNAVALTIVLAQDYTANNSGRTPTLQELKDSQDQNGIVDVTIVDTVPITSQVQFQTQTVCADMELVPSESSRSFAARALLSDGSFYCLDNS